jgi:tyrosine aminotransferase
MGKITADDVILTSGCSMAIEIACRSLANIGDNILVPTPGWNYATWLLSGNINPRYYNLDPDKNWKIDLEHLESLIDSKTRAIVVNSPGNPCGNVFSKEHILNIID